MDLFLDSSALIEDGELLSHQKRVREDIDAVSGLVCRARNLQRGNSSAEGAGGPKGLGRSFVAARIEDEARRDQAHEFVVRRTQFTVEAVVGKIENASQFAV